MSKEMFIASSPHETRVAVCEDDLLVELYIERDTDVGLVGGIYKGRVNRVLPGMQSAFVDIGLERDAFLYVSDFSFQGEEFEGLLEEMEGKGPVTLPASSAEAQDQPSREAGESPGAAGSSGAEAFASAEPGPAPAASTVESGEAAPPASSEPATLNEAPAASAAEPPSPTAPEHGEFRRQNEHRGRRRRRGRRGFGEARFSRRPEPRKESQPRTPSAPSQPTFEILPGESLAKYSRPTTGATSEPQAPALSDSVSLHPEPAREAAQPEVERGSTSTPGDSGEPRRASIEPPPPLATGASGFPTQTPEAPRSEFQTETLPNETAEFTEAGSPPVTSEAEAVESKHDALEGPASEAAEPDAPERAILPEAASSEAQAPSEAAPAVERQVTLREPHQRPHFAPRRRGRRPMRGGYRQENRQSAPRSGNNQPVKISEVLKEGQEILVQIAKEPLGTKGARITSHIALPGRYLVYMPTITHIGVSRKITSEQERLRLRNIILDHRGSLTGGFIVRTAAEGRSEEEIKADLRFLTALWNETRAKAERSKAPALIYRDLDLVQRILRDVLTPDFKCIRVDSEAEYERVVEFVSKTQPALLPNVKLHTREIPLFEEAGISAEIEKALRPKIWLKSGGYIVINQTEALVAIDVNTGKYVGKTNRLEDTILKTNIDAVKEIVRQIRLRDLGGIIVVDFIDMDERRNRNRVVQALEDALRSDRAPTKVLSFNEFGLVALTRKRVKQSLQRTLCEPCNYCNGGGWVKSPMTVSYEILSEARKMAGNIDSKIVTLRVHPEVAKYLKTRDGVLISEIENLMRKEVVIKSDPTIHQEQFEIF